MHLLFLAHRLPYPPNKGDKIRSFRWLDHLSRKYDVHLGCFVDRQEDMAHVETLRPGLASVAAIPLDPRLARLRALARLRPGMPLSVGYFHDRRLRAWVRQTRRNHPIERALVFSSAMAPYLDDAEALPTLFDMVDLDSEKFAAYGAESGGLRALVWRREARTLLALERAATARFTRTFLVSDAERDRFTALAPETGARTEAVPNGVDTGFFDPGQDWPNPYPPDRPAIVFTGAMDYRPNIDACLWFAQSVMPDLARDRPGPVFHIVGADPAPQIRALAAHPSIDVHPDVPDIRPYLRHAALAVAPLRIARGIQNKVLEAMAMARPVLTTTAALTGISAIAGRDALVADDAAAMLSGARAILRGEWPGLGAAGRASVTANHGWSTALAALDRVLA